MKCCKPIFFALFLATIGCAYNEADIDSAGIGVDTGSDTGTSTGDGSATDAGDGDTGGGDTGADDSGGNDTGGELPLCEAVLPFEQNFGSDNPSQGKWFEWGSSNTNVFLESDGLVIEPLPNITGYNGSGYRSFDQNVPDRPQFNLADGRLNIKITEMVNTDQASEFMFFIGVSATYNYAIRQESGLLEFRRRERDSNTISIASVPYDSSKTFWQLRQSGDTVIAEFGPNADELIELGRDTIDSPAKREIVESSDIYFGTQSNTPLSAPGRAKIDSFNFDLGNCIKN